MKISEQGLKLIKKWEGCELQAYLDAVGVATIGYGCIAYPDGQKVRLGDKITQEQADALLLEECLQKAEAVASLVKVGLNQNQFDALVSLSFNIGEGALAESTLLRRLNASDFGAAAEQFLVWNKGTVNGVKVVIEGLSNRRKDEKKLFESSGQSGQPLSLEPSPQERVTWLEAYGEQGKTLVVGWDKSQVVEILELQSPSKQLLMETISQYPKASNLLIAAKDKTVPQGERIKVQARRVAASRSDSTGSGQSTPIPILSAGVISRGSTGEDVRVLQQRLDALGYYSGPIDADFGSGTDAAVRSFQSDILGSAQADGRVGPITWAALWAASTAEADPTPANAGAPGKTYLRLTKTSQRDKYGLTILHLDYIKSGVAQDRLEVCSGAPGRQAFRTGAQSQPMSFEPLPEGVWSIQTIAWCDGKDNYNGRIFASGLGPVSTPISFKGPGTTRRSAIEIHLDWNRNDGAPGTAGCIGIHSVHDYKKLVTWLRESNPQELFVDWGLGTCPAP
jgi:lysozyme